MAKVKINYNVFKSCKNARAVRLVSVDHDNEGVKKTSRPNVLNKALSKSIPNGQPQFIRVEGVRSC